MSAIPKPKLTPEEYLAIERKADFKSEYYRGEMFAMAGASEEHCLVKDNLAREIGMQLKNGPCRLATSDLRVRVDPSGLYTYPDIVIYCDKPKFIDHHFDTLVNPTVLIEVLSDSTENYDLGDKFRHYRQIESLQEYVDAWQDEPFIERRIRQSNGQWLLADASGLDAILEFTSIPARVPLAELYRNVDFPEKPLR
jgi:Uma2 family endonuclease